MAEGEPPNYLTGLALPPVTLDAYGNVIRWNPPPRPEDMGWVLNADGSAESPNARVTLDAYGNVIRPTEQREPRVDDTTDSTGVISGWTLTPTPQPLSDAIRLSGQQKAVYEIDKRTHRVKFSEETEEFVKVTIEPKDSPA